MAMFTAYFDAKGFPYAETILCWDCARVDVVAERIAEVEYDMPDRDYEAVPQELTDAEIEELDAHCVNCNAPEDFIVPDDM